LSFTITVACPEHPRYDALSRPDVPCECCLIMFEGRRDVHKIVATPAPERANAAERIIHGVDEELGRGTPRGAARSWTRKRDSR
jgi:hypothetical protein